MRSFGVCIFGVGGLYVSTGEVGWIIVDSGRGCIGVGGSGVISGFVIWG